MRTGSAGSPRLVLLMAPQLPYSLAAPTAAETMPAAAYTELWPQALSPAADGTLQDAVACVVSSASSMPSWRFCPLLLFVAEASRTASSQ